MTELVIEAHSLTKDHISPILRKPQRVLDGLNLLVTAGQAYGLLGLNGAGKTTTLKLLTGLLKPTRGSISILGYKAGDKRGLQKLGFLPENPYLYSYLTAAEFLDFCGQLFGLNSNQRKQRASQLIEMVSLQKSTNLPVRKYSKGMMQRLAIAQALINDPAVLFLDEPMSGLDPIGRRDMRLILLGLKEQGKTIFLNSHLLPDVSEICDRVGILHQGKLLAEKDLAEAKGSYRELEDYFMNTVEQAEAKQ